MCLLVALDQMGEQHDAVTYQEVDGTCCIQFKAHQHDPQAQTIQQEECGAPYHFSQFYATKYAYQLMREHEAEFRTTFKYIIKVCTFNQL